MCLLNAEKMLNFQFIYEYDNLNSINYGAHLPSHIVFL